MNLFLLLAVPLFALVLWRLLYRESTWKEVLPTAAFLLVWAFILLVTSILLSGWVIDNGDPWTTALGDLMVSGLLIPGAVVALNLVPGVLPKAARTARERQLDIFLLLALVLAAVGLGEFLASNRQSGPWELFLLPFLRMIWLVGLPWLAGRWLSDSRPLEKALKLAGLVALSGSVAPVHFLWLNQWGWLAVLLELTLAASLVLGVLGDRLPGWGKKRRGTPRIEGSTSSAQDNRN